MPDGGVAVVAEAAFQDELWRRGLEPLLDGVRLRIVQCIVEADVAWLPETFERLSLDAPTLEVDTTDGYRPPLEQIASFAAA